MLTADLLRASVRNGAITPRFVPTDDPGLVRRADDLVALFRQNEGGTRGELDELLDDIVGDETHFAVTRGLCKLLHDRSTWETVSPIDPVDLRRHIFEASAAAHPVGTARSRLHETTREDILSRVADALGVSADEVEAGMYADLKAEQRLTRFRPIDGLALLHRYNLAQAQGLLFRAHELRVTVGVDRPSRLRQVFRWLKFHQLMHRTVRGKDGYAITIDGPLSLFAQSQRYGLQMAKFLPALLLADRWSMEADVDWPHAKKPLRFTLTPESGLTTHLRSKGTWITEEEREITRRVDEHASSWKVSRKARVIDLGGRDVLVPDFTVVCEETGREAHVEIIGFWRRAYLERRLEVLAQHGPSNLVLCVSRKMAAEKHTELQAMPSHVVEFAKVIPLGRFLESVDAAAGS